jgi:hypothetical protein
MPNVSIQAPITPRLITHIAFAILSLGGTTAHATGSSNPPRFNIPTPDVRIVIPQQIPQRVQQAPLYHPPRPLNPAAPIRRPSVFAAPSHRPQP